LYLLEHRDHDIWAVVDCENNVGDASSGQAFHLVENHGTIGELNQWLGKCEGLDRISVFWSD
jgi:hypothetical protein